MTDQELLNEIKSLEASINSGEYDEDETTFLIDELEALEKQLEASNSIWLNKHITEQDAYWNRLGISPQDQADCAKAIEVFSPDELEEYSKIKRLG